jgi:phosphoribosylformylglycinamidine synthase
VADPAIVAVVRDLVREGRVTSATDLSLGGLLAALVKVAPQADVTLTGDPLEELFSETYGRFLVAVRDEAALAGVEHRIIGRVGGDALTLRLKGETVIITPEELETALSSTTRQMRF